MCENAKNTFARELTNNSTLLGHPKRTRTEEGKKERKTFRFFFLFVREKKRVIDRQMLTFFNLRESEREREEEKSKPLKLTDEESDQLSFCQL